MAGIFDEILRTLSETEANRRTKSRSERRNRARARKLGERTDWQALLQNAQLATTLAVVDKDGPNWDQQVILKNALNGTSLVACGPYGVKEDLALQAAAVEMCHRYKDCEPTSDSEAVVLPTVIHVSSTWALRDQFAKGTRAISNGGVQIGNADKHTSNIDMSCCEWDIMCTMSIEFRKMIQKGTLSLTKVRLLIFEEANVFFSKAWKDCAEEISNEFAKRSLQPIRLYLASDMTTGQQNAMLEQLSGQSLSCIEFNKRSEFEKGTDISFTVLANQHAEALRPQQTRNLIMESILHTRPVIVFTPEPNDVRPLLNELREFMIEVEEVQLGYQQVLSCGISQRFIQEKCHVLVVSVHDHHAGIIAPILQHLTRDISVFVYRLHESDKTRDPFEKWLDLLGRLSRIPYVTRVHTFIESGRKTDIESMYRWLGEVRGKVPVELLRTVLPANVAETTKKNIEVANK